MSETTVETNPGVSRQSWHCHTVLDMRHGSCIAPADVLQIGWRALARLALLKPRAFKASINPLTHTERELPAL